MNFVTYDPASGEIHSFGADDAPDVPTGMSLLADCTGTYDSGYVHEGVFTPYTSAQAAAKAARPDYDCRWDNTAMAWQDLRVLAQAQADQIAALTAAYDTAISQAVPFTTVAGVAQTYQADAGSISNCTAAMLGCQGAQATPTGFYWLAVDNTQVPFTYADLQGLAAAFLAQGAPAFAKLQTLKNAVRAATTVAAVAAVVW